MRLKLYIAIAFLFASFFSLKAENNFYSSLNEKQKLFIDELIFNDSHEVLRHASSHLHQDSYYFGSGGDLFGQFIQFLFPLTSRENRIVFMPLTTWGPKKPQYKKFDWQKYESKHFAFYFDKDAQDSFEKAHAYLEDDFERNNEIFSVRNKFLKKIPIIIYQSRKDFEQTNIVSGPVPEGLGGVTEIFSWKRAVFPFEAELSTFEHVTKHEGTHIYQIAKGAKNLPLWFIEGSAETNSIYWDADAEQFIRDAYLNDLFFNIDELWQIRGTWLMYKIGNYICNFIREKYGERALQKIYQNSVTLGFKDNIKKSLGISLQELNRMVQASLSIKYGKLYKKNNLYDSALKLQKRSVVLHAYKNFFISGKSNGASSSIYINSIGNNGTVSKQKVVSDKKINNESLNYFRKGAWLNDSKIIYSIKNGANDEIRLLDYIYKSKEKKFKFKKEQSFRFPQIRSIFSPVVIDDRNIAFIGIKDGYSNIYSYDFKQKKLKAITSDSAHYSNLDFSRARNTLIYSKELERLPNRIYYNRDLFEYNVQTKSTIQLTKTPNIRENYPKYSVSGTNILYSSDEDGTHNLYLYNTLTQAKQKLSNHPSGIKTASWSDNDSLLMNINKRFVSDIVHLPLPKPSEMLVYEIDLDQSNPIPVYSKGKEFIYISEAEKYIDRSELKVEFGRQQAIKHKQNISSLTFEGEQYTINRVAPFENELFVQASNVSNSKKRIQAAEDQTFYFKVSDNKIESIYNPTIQKDSSSESIKKQLGKILKDKVIISTWVFKEDANVLVQVNEKLSGTSASSQNSNKVVINLYSCDLNKNACNLLKGANLGNFKKDIFWVSKLKNNSYIWTLSEAKRGPYEVFLYDGQRKKTIKVGNEILRFKVSESKQSFAMLLAGSFIVYSFSKDKGWCAKQYKPGGSIIGYDFLSDSDSFVIVSNSKRTLNVHTLNQKETRLKKIKHSIRNIAYATINNNNGDFVVYAKANTEKSPYEKLYYWSKQEQEFYDISIRGKLKKFYSVVFVDDFLVFTGKNFAYEKPETWVWKNKERKRLNTISKVKELSSSNLWIANLNNSLFNFDFSNNKFNKIVDQVLGYDIYQRSVIYASTNNEKYNIYQYDLDLEKANLIIESENHAFGPRVYKDEVFYESYNNNELSVKRFKLKTKRNLSDFKLKNHHIVIAKEMSDAKRVKFNLIPYQNQPYLGPDLKIPQLFPIEGKSEPAKDIYKLQSLLAAAAYDGRNFRILLNGFADNIFSDKGVFANIILLGENRFAVLGFANLRTASSYSMFFNDRENIQNFGFNYNKRFNIDRYRAFNLLTEIERQVYGEATSDTVNYVDSSVENRSFNVIKASISYDHDVTLWDRHGPISGSRIFFRLGSGVDLTEQRLAFYSANADIRYYNAILNKFSLAHRVVGGTSQGALPEIYLAGGNLSFRGVSFDSLQGQNYAIFSEDIRLPLFDFIGAKFFDPLDRFVGFLTKFFDVRTGAFIDVGDVWYNDEDFDLMYASGFFANVPSLLGANLRFHYSVWGEQGFGFWIGSNW